MLFNVIISVLFLYVISIGSIAFDKMNTAKKLEVKNMRSQFMATAKAVELYSDITGYLPTDLATADSFFFGMVGMSSDLKQGRQSTRVQYTLNGNNSTLASTVFTGTPIQSALLISDTRTADLAQFSAATANTRNMNCTGDGKAFGISSSWCPSLNPAITQIITNEDAANQQAEAQINVINRLKSKIDYGLANGVVLPNTSGAWKLLSSYVKPTTPNANKCPYGVFPSSGYATGKVIPIDCVDLRVDKSKSIYINSTASSYTLTIQ